jgi:hypothetical protein
MQSTIIPTTLIQNKKKHPPTAMYYHHNIHILIYEGDEDPNFHWFICETIWDATTMTDKEK